MAEQDGKDMGDDKAALPRIIASEINFVRVAASEVAGFALDENGQLWAWGRFRDNDGSSFFLDGQDEVQEPLNVSLLHDLSPIVDIAAGHSHVVFMTESGKVYGWGITSCGVLGPKVYDGRAFLSSPCISFPDGFTADRLFAGGYSTFIMGTYTCGRKAILACGRNKEGELGVGSLNSVVELTEVDFSDVGRFDVGTIVEIAAGLEHTLFRTLDGDVYGCGTSRNGELGFDRLRCRSPFKVSVAPAAMVSAGTGGCHSYVVSTACNVFVAGANTHWQLLRDRGEDGEEELVKTFTCREFKIPGTGDQRKVVFSTGGIQFSIWGLEQD
ncbi:regulator of chromosome condensation 1/beta-lactamase-inhibitor protein II [Chytridium lagenaria]|nr:regulator of chromosome condensation 1/beta-lactamase-inhibitor protein II [Chytridium lagenaria]